MALPVNVATCTVTGTFVNADGTIPATGSVTFTPVPARILDASATPPTTIVGTPIVATLTAGAFSVTLPASDDADLNPTDWTYHVSVRLPTHAYWFCMDAPEGAVDLADVTPIIGSEGDAIIAGPPGPEGPPGSGEGVPEGGDAGEVLAKLSGTDYDTDWVPASAPGVHASTHAAASTDPVTIETSQVTGLTAALAAKQPLDSDLTIIAALAPASDTIIQRKVGQWVASTPTEYKSDLALTKSDVGLGNVDNTSDANKPVSSATTTALALKADKTTTISTTAPLAGGGSLAANRTITVATFDSAAAGVVPPSGGGTADFLRADGTWAQPPGVAGVSNTLTYSYNTTTTEPPIGNQLRLNSTTFTAATRLWVAVVTVDGLDASIGLARILAGNQIYFQDRDNASNWVKYNVTADGVDDGSYYDFVVAYHSGPGGIPAGQIEFQLITPGTVGVPPGGTTGQVLAKESGSDYDVDWADPSGGSTFDDDSAGIVPASGGGTSNFLRADATWAAPPGGGGGITGITVSEAGSALDTDITTLDFGAGFDLTESPENEINIALDLSEYSGATLPQASVANLTTDLAAKASTTDLTTHAADTTSIHGITDTSVLETTTGAQAKVDTHVNDTTAAHAATAISYAGSTALSATTVEAALDELDTEKQPLDSDLTTIAGLTATTDNVIQSVSSAWASRTPAQLKTTLALTKTDVGLANVDNTTDAAKPISTATQTALDAKVDKTVTLNAQTGTTYTVVLTDVTKLVTLTNASAITVTVPANSTTAFPTGSTIDLAQLGAGAVTVTPAGGVTVNATPSRVFRAQYSAATLTKYATDTWLLVGDLT